MSLLLLLVLAPLIGMAFGVHTDRDEEFRLEGTAAPCWQPGFAWMVRLSSTGPAGAQGLIAGLIVGSAVVVALAWYRSRLDRQVRRTARRSGRKAAWMCSSAEGQPRPERRPVDVRGHEVLPTTR
jgi:hypothetical protein